MKQVGNTPIVKYENLYFKLENQNPTGRGGFRGGGAQHQIPSAPHP